MTSEGNPAWVYDPPYNTQSMNMRPTSPDAFSMLDHSSSDFQMLPVMTGEKFIELVNYPIIVECWDRKKSGRVRRRWEEEFDQAERRKIGRYHGRFYRWYLVSGSPDRVACAVRTLRLLQRAVAFFATV